MSNPAKAAKFVARRRRKAIAGVFICYIYYNYQTLKRLACQRFAPSCFFYCFIFSISSLIKNLKLNALHYVLNKIVTNFSQKCGAECEISLHTVSHCRLQSCDARTTGFTSGQSHQSSEAVQRPTPDAQRPRQATLRVQILPLSVGRWTLGVDPAPCSFPLRAEVFLIGTTHHFDAIALRAHRLSAHPPRHATRPTLHFHPLPMKPHRIRRVQESDTVLPACASGAMSLMLRIFTTILIRKTNLQLAPAQPGRAVSLSCPCVQFTPHKNVIACFARQPFF